MVEVGKTLGYNYNAQEGLVVVDELALVGRSHEFGHNPWEGLVGGNTCMFLKFVELGR